MRLKQLIAVGIFVGNFLFLQRPAMALATSATDLWDISNGTVVTDTSGVLNYRIDYRSSIENMFGGSGGVGVSVETYHTLFKDYMAPGLQGGSVPAGYIHYVNWSTPSAITLRSFNLLAANEGMDRRAFDRFELFADTDNDGMWESIFVQEFAASPDNPYGYGGSPTYGANSTWLELAVNLASPVVAHNFRAEFRQAPWTDPRAVGPRVMELDGYDTYITTVPIPAAVILFGSGIFGLIGISFRTKKRV